MSRRYTPDTYHERLQEAWFKNLPDEADWSLFPRRTEDERRERYISDLERAALTILLGATAFGNDSTIHPILRVMIHRYASDPAYTGGVPDPDTITADEWRIAHHLSRDQDPEPVVEESRKRGYWAVEDRRLFVLTYPPDEHDDYDFELYIQYRQDMDKAALRLLIALDTHRDKGEEGMETAVGLGPDVALFTSLAAAVAEYHAYTLQRTRQFYSEWKS